MSPGTYLKVQTGSKNMEGNSDVSSAPTFETQTIVGAGSAAAINRIHHLSSRSLQLTVEQYG